MDDDTKTLLAVLALVYGSSNGIGLFKTAMDDVEKKRKTLKDVDRKVVDAKVIGGHEEGLRKSLLSFASLVYVVFVVVPVVFLAFVVRLGPHAALALLGLQASTPVPFSRPPFFWILLALIGLSSIQLISPWLGGWGTLIKSKFS